MNEFPMLHHYAVGAVAGMLIAITIIMYVLNRGKSKYYARDLLMNAQGKADLDKHILVVMALMSVWVVVVKTLGLYKGDDVTTLLLGILGVFVGKRGLDNYLAARKEKDDDK